ncbi:MAG: hypothetical protein AAGF92_14430 [Myxococcota bacterium]
MLLLAAGGCGDDAPGDTGGSGGSGAGGTAGTAGMAGTGGNVMVDPDRFPWTMAVSIVQVDTVSSGSVFDIGDWCDGDDRGEFFVRYLLDPPGEDASTLLDLEFDAGGPTDTEFYGERFRRTYTVSAANELAQISTTDSFENDGVVDDNLSDFIVTLENIPPNAIDFTDVGCAEYGYMGSAGRNDCDDGCIITRSNRAKPLCFMETTICIQNVSDPNR